MSELHKSEPNKIGSKPHDASKHSAKTPLDGAKKPGDQPIDSEPSAPAKKPTATPAAAPNRTKF